MTFEVSAPGVDPAQERAIVAEYLDVAYYLHNNPEVLEANEDPVDHFCRIGWRELRKPAPDFDVWWYWVNHLDLADDSLNPLVHYALVGKARGLSTRPASTVARPAQPLAADRPVRRATLVAGYDADGVVDPAVIELVRELSRHSDVFYLFDGYLAPEELAKLDDLTAGSWAIRHGAYDFGSYSKLATELVGWDRLSQYDEVLFVNDSCFLVRPLDDVFAEMNARSNSWWGLQATKGLASTRSQPGNGFRDPVPLDVVRDSHLAAYEDDPIYDFHVGSYFLAFRRPVLEDPVFRKLVASIGKQPSKLLIIQKYEIGLTHLLIGRGFGFDTFIPALYPFHPVFTEWYFELLKQGFPLLKRFFLYRNTYDVPGLVQWKERVLQWAPEADVDMLEATLLRTAPADELHRSFSITTADDGTVAVPEVVQGRDFTRLSRRTVKQPSLWLFVVDPRTHRLPDNSRAIFEAVKDDPDLTKVILTRSRRIDLTGVNVVTAPVLSPQGRELLARAGRIFVANHERRTFGVSVSEALGRRVIVVRDGLQLEKSGRALTSFVPTVPKPDTEELPLVHPVPKGTVSGLLVSSDLDQLASLATHWPATYDQAWRTGIPAHDFLQTDEELLPADLGTQLRGVRADLQGRRLLLLAPTRRASGSDREPYRYAEDEVAQMATWCQRNDFVLGIRESVDDAERAYSALFGEHAIDLSHRRYPLIHAVLRAADGVLTDYSGYAMDYASSGGRVMSFAHDLDIAQERLLYDLEHMFPGPVHRSFEALESDLDFFIDGPATARHKRVRDMLVDRQDGRNTERVVARLADLREDVEA